MTEKQVDRVLRMMKRRKGMTWEQLEKLCEDMGNVSMSGLHPFFSRRYKKPNVNGFPVVSPDDPVRVNDAGLNRLAAKREKDRATRWTRGLAIAAIVISMLALVVSVLSNFDEVTSAWNSLAATNSATAQEPHSQGDQGTIP